jgi:hypothetical protein
MWSTPSTISMRSTCCNLVTLLSIVCCAAGCATTRRPGLCSAQELRGEEVAIYRAALLAHPPRSSVLWHLSIPITEPIEIPASRKRRPDPRAPWEALDGAARERANSVSCLVTLSAALGLQPTAEPQNRTLSLTAIGIADGWAYFQYSEQYDYSVQTSGVLLESSDKGEWRVMVDDTIKFADLKR